MSVSSPSNDMRTFREIVKKAKHVAILTGAGISAESGVPTFRGEGGFWRKYQAQHLASPTAFLKDPGLVWEFYHYRRELVLTKSPNKAHDAIAEFEKRLDKQGKRVVVITQNVDELHRRAGTEKLIELHGSLFKTICIKCWHEEQNYDNPICEGLRGKGAPDAETKNSKLSEDDLPRCKQNDCGGLLRPGVVWFGETLRDEVLAEAGEELNKCDLCLVVGTSSVVYPAAMFAPQVAARGVPVAEFNLESTPETNNFGYHFSGPCGTTLPEALAE